MHRLRQLIQCKFAPKLRSHYISASRFFLRITCHLLNKIQIPFRIKMLVLYVLSRYCNFITEQRYFYTSLRRCSFNKNIREVEFFVILETERRVVCAFMVRRCMFVWTNVPFIFDFNTNYLRNESRNGLTMFCSLRCLFSTNIFLIYFFILHIFYKCIYYIYSISM